MALLVKDCLNIGILEQATVVAGSTGLMRPVESVTVVEFNGFQNSRFKNMLTGNELAVTALSFLCDMPKNEWPAFFDNLISSRFSCIVVFYCGTVLAEIPDMLLEMADAHALPIIVMPGDAKYPYSDLILPICEAILNDKRMASRDNTFFTDILNEMLGLNRRDQNVQSLLTSLSNRTHYNLILTDINFSPFAWSLANLKVSVPNILNDIWDSMGNNLPLTPQAILYTINDQRYQIRFQPIRTNKLIGSLLIMQEDGSNVSIDVSNQIADIITLCLQLWRLSYGQLTELELQLNGDVQNVQPKKYKNIVVIGRRDGLPLKINDLQFNRLDYNQAIPSGYMERAVFKGNIVLAGSEQGINYKNVLSYSDQILSSTAELRLGKMSLNTQRLHDACHTIIEAIPTASIIFPHLEIFSEEHILFVQELNSLKNTMSSGFPTLADILLPLRAVKEWQRLFETLAITYLDCGGSAANAAEILWVHVNTIKYRISCAKNILGITFDSPLNYSRLVLALAVARLLE